jgi:hypothetical protein
MNAMKQFFRRSVGTASFPHLLVILLLTLQGCGLAPTPEENEVIHFNGDFETGSLSQFHFLVADSAACTQLVTSPVRKGAYALRNQLRPGDYANNGYRTELAIYHCAPYNTEVYYGFSFLIDSAYGDPAYNLICQWQDLPNYLQGEDWTAIPNVRGSSPPLALVYADGAVQLKMNSNPRSDDHTFAVGEARAIPKGVWHDAVFRIYWSDKDHGYVEAMLDGSPLTPFNGTDHLYFHRNLFNRSGNYFKFGQYRGKDNPEVANVIYFDEVKVGTSYAEVTP